MASHKKSKKDSKKDAKKELKKAAKKKPAAKPPKPAVARPPAKTAHKAHAKPGTASLPPPVAAPSKGKAAEAAHKAHAADEAKPHATPAPKKASRKGQRGGREGKNYPPGELLIPGGCQTSDEALYFFRGCIAAEHAVGEEGLADVLTRRGLSEGDPATDEARRQLITAVERFASGVIEPLLPSRAQARRTFVGFVERVRGRRREIGAFLRGLDLGRTEVSHLDSHGESSLQNLMEWTARIEKMIEEGEEPEHADYNQLHRGIDQLDATTEALVVDVELTLKRLRDRLA